MLKILKILRSISAMLDKTYRVTSLLCLSAMVLLSSMEIFSRFVLGYSFVWVPGMVILFSNWMIFLGMGVYLNRRQNLEVSYFYRKFFTPPVRKAVDIAVDAFLAVFIVLLLRSTFLVILMEQYQSSLVNIPIKAFWYTMPLFLGCVLAVLSRFEGIMELILGEEHRKEHLLWP